MHIMRYCLLCLSLLNRVNAYYIVDCFVGSLSVPCWTGLMHITLFVLFVPLFSLKSSIFQRHWILWNFGGVVPGEPCFRPNQTSIRRQYQTKPLSGDKAKPNLLSGDNTKPSLCQETVPNQTCIRWQCKLNLYLETIPNQTFIRKQYQTNSLSEHNIKSNLY